MNRNVLWLLYTGDRIDADEACHMGLVNRIVPLAELLATAREMADKNAPKHERQPRRHQGIRRETGT